MRASALALPVAVAAAALFAAAAPAAADAPAVVIEGPEDGALFNTSGTMEHAAHAMVGATAAVTDADAPASELNVSFALEPPLAAAAPGGNFSLVLTPIGSNAVRARLEVWLPEGTYTLTWTAVDAGGNTTTASSSFAVDLQGPRVAVTAPALSSTPDVWVTIDVVDGVSGVDPADVRVLFRSACNATWGDVPASLVALGGHVVGEAHLDLCTGRDNVLQVFAHDRAGHGNSTGLLSITHDPDPPAVSAHQPAPFATADGPLVVVSALIQDAVAGTNASAIEYQVSADGGLTWGPWSRPAVRAFGASLEATAEVSLAPGAAAAVRWRAYDWAGNGPGEQRVVHFTVNGPPFLISFTPEEGDEIIEGREITFSARFADPDADFVRTSFYSDLDGYLGELSGRHEIDTAGDSFARQLTRGVHNITVVGEDGHGNRAVYTYPVAVIARPPPDLRPFVAIPLMGVAMVAAAWLAWRRAEEMDEET